jgi:hypothetical protein
MGKPAVAAAIVFIVAGCGGTQRPAHPVSRAAFADDAGAVCAEAATRSGRLARLRALKPPASEADLFAHWLTAEKDAGAAAALEGRPKSGEEDPAVALAIAEGKIAGYARRLGVEACAHPAIGTMPP